MPKHLYIFVEGATDELFIDKLIKKNLSFLKDNYTIVNYAAKEKRKVMSYITSIKSIPNCDYVFIADQDGQANKKEQKLKEFPCLDKEKVFIAIYEIESWIIAGISTDIIKRYKIKLITSDTSDITKEIFDSIIPKKLDKIEFISYILSDYNLKQAIKFNESLKEFIDFLSKDSVILCD